MIGTCQRTSFDVRTCQRTFSCQNMSETVFSRQNMSEVCKKYVRRCQKISWGSCSFLTSMSLPVGFHPPLPSGSAARSATGQARCPLLRAKPYAAMPLKRPAASVLKKLAASAAEPDVAQLTTAHQIGEFLFGHDEDETSRRLAFLSDSQRQTLTKMFERARKEHGQEYDAVSLQGAGANRKKGELLLAWLQHGFNETYCTLAAKIVMKQSRLTWEEWIPLPEAQHLYGRFELKKRLC